MIKREQSLVIGSLIHEGLAVRIYLIKIKSYESIAE